MRSGTRLSDAEVAIIGAGPAGIAAAVQLKRYGIEPLVFEKGRIGGLLWNANLVENYPGFPGGIPGPELVGKLEAQLRKASVDVIYEEVVRLEEGFGLKTEGGSYTADIVVVASGTEPRRFPGRISEKVEGRVFYEVYPLRDLAGARVAVVGAGDAAFDYALNLARRNEVVLLNRGYKPKCLPLLWERARTTPSIAYREDVEVMEVLPSEGGVGLLCRTDGGEEKVEIDYVLFAIGRQPKLDFMSPELRGRTLERLHFIGDVKNGRFRQTAIAVGDGIRVAMEIALKRHLDGSPLEASTT